MDSSLIISFLAASILLTLMPGPDLLYVVMESITRGVRTGINISLGLVSGLIIHTFLAALGVSIIFQQSETAFNVLKIFGTLYLLYMAFQAWKEKPPNLSHTSENQIKGFFSLWQKGFLMNVLNPKVSLFFIALLPQFVSPTGYRPSIQMILLGILFMLQAIIFFAIVSLMAGRLNRYLQDSRFWKYAQWSKIVILLILAIGLALYTH